MTVKFICGNIDKKKILNGVLLHTISLIILISSAFHQNVSESKNISSFLLRTYLTVDMF